ncbi:MAG: hypothetical protein ACI9TO_000442 [Rickettsiales bacterium]|jgi:hypothetical protein
MPNISENQELITYQSIDGKISFNVNVFEESVWLTQKQMAELFGRERSVITKHINNIFKEEELIRKRNVHFLHIPFSDKPVEIFNLNVIISVGYRIKSQRGTQFRIWATGVLKQYLLGGYAINGNRIKSLEARIDNLSTELRQEFKSEIRQINKSLLEIANRPITINNQISLAGHKLEEKTAELLGEIIEKIKDEKLKNKLEEIKEDIRSTTKDQKSRNNIIQFFTKLGDKNSNLHKTIQGAGMSKKIITELVKLGEKLKDFIF